MEDKVGRTWVEDRRSKEADAACRMERASMRKFGLHVTNAGLLTYGTTREQTRDILSHQLVVLHVVSKGDEQR